MRFFLKYPFFIAFCFLITCSFIGGGCAQIGAPTGGDKDTLPPKLIKATPAYESRNVKTNKITLEFNEYIDVTDLSQNMVISPLQNKTPSVIINAKSIVVKFRDSLLPNTTYTINFGKAVKDINEGNIYEDLSFSFSTGNSLDSLTLNGKLISAETGATDSTMLVMLYRNASDSAVKKIKPNYIANVKGDGSFHFDHLPADSFRIYALKDGDGGRTYNSPAEAFAFIPKKVFAGAADDIVLYAYAEEKKQEEKKVPAAKLNAEKKLRYTIEGMPFQDLLKPMEISFNNPLKKADSAGIYLTDTLFHKLNISAFSIDSTAKKISLRANWPPEVPMILIIEKNAVFDSTGLSPAKTDTIKFSTKKTEDYGKVIFHFSNLDLKKNPVLEFLSGEDIKYVYPLHSAEWSENLFPPGEYGIRILYDTDKNGKWTPGNYARKQQPELTITLPQKIGVRADFDNEREISL